MDFLKRLSLKNKLMLMFTLAILIPALAIFIQLKIIKEKIVEEKAETMYSFASGVSHNIATQFFERYGDVQAFTKNSVLFADDKKAISDALNKYIVAYGTYDLIVLVNPEGKFLGASSSLANGKQLDITPLENYDFSKEDFFRAVKEDKYTTDSEKGFDKTYFSDFQIDPLTSMVLGTDQIGTSFSTKVFDANGNLRGILTARSNMNWIEEGIKAVYSQLKNTGYNTANMILVNNNGKVIVDYNPSENEWKEEFTHDLKNLQLVKDLSTSSPTISKALKRESGSIRFYDEEEKHNHVGGYLSLSSPKWIGAIGWAVAVELNEADATKSIDYQLTIITIVIGIITFLVLMWALFFSKNISTQFNLLARSVEDGAGKILTSSNGIASTAGQLSQAVNEQAASLQETVASIDEINAMVAKNADSAKSSKEMATKSKQLAEDGKATVDQMLGAINDITQSNEEINKQIAESNLKIGQIVNVINEIGQKTKIINDIVFQTKLLSFNASVEAARAGEHGKGFAVVAEEVGNLASMSGNASKEISTLLESSTRHVEGLVRETSQKVAALMSQGRDKVQRGTDTANECSKSLDAIIENVSGLTDLVSEIAVASEEQAHGITQVTQAMGQLDNVTQQNTVVANSSSQAAEELHAQSETLNQVVVEFRNLLNGRASSSQPNPDIVGAQEQKLIKKATKEKKEKKKTEKPPTVESNKVIKLNVKKAAPHIEIKQVSGSEIPSSDDPRFEEV